MAITTYAELQTSVSNWLHRADLATYVPDLITMGETRIMREVRARPMEYSFSDVIHTAEQQNMILYSQDFDNSAWTKSNTTVSSATAPDGSLTASKVVENTTLGGQHGVFQAAIPDAPAGTYTTSIYARKGTQKLIALVTGNPTESFVFSYFNLESGTVGTTASGVTSAMDYVGNGWYRCSCTFTVSSVTPSGGTIYSQVIMAEIDGTDTYNGDGSSYVYIWGAQLEESSSVNGYIATTSSPEYLGAGRLPLPNNYLELKQAYIDRSPVQWLKRQKPQMIYEKYPTRSSAGLPKYIARDGNSFIFGPYPDSNYAVKGTYYRNIGPVSSNAHALFTENPDLYLFAALAEAEPFLKNDKRVALWEQKYQKIKNDVNGLRDREDLSGSDLQMVSS